MGGKSFGSNMSVAFGLLGCVYCDFRVGSASGGLGTGSHARGLSGPVDGRLGLGMLGPEFAMFASLVLC